MTLEEYRVGRKDLFNVLYNPITMVVLDYVVDKWVLMDIGYKFGINEGRYIPIAKYTPSKEDLLSNSWVLIPRYTS